MKTPEFLKNKEEEMQDGDLQELKKLVDKFKKLESEITLEEDKVKNLKQEFNHYSLELIPQFLLANGLSEIKLKSGEKITIKEEISVTIKDDVLFHLFLEGRDESDILKTQFNFGQMEQESLEDLFAYLLANDYEYDVKKAVHAQTQKKYFKELLGVGKTDFEEGKYLAREDVEMFAKIFTYHITKVK